MALLPKFQSSDQNFNLLQTKWASILNPIISNPITSPTILPGVKINAGQNIVSHKLQANLQGWWIVRQDGKASIYDQQDSNSTPNLTLNLISDGACTITLAVF